MKDHAASQEAEASHRPLLSGATVLVVEDEALLAHDLASTIEENGGRARGPIHRLDKALACTDLHDLDVALLDVDIRGEEVFAFADRLQAAHVPIVFHTARADVTGLLLHYPEAAVVDKPCLARGIVVTLASAIRQQRVSARARP